MYNNLKSDYLRCKQCPARARRKQQRRQQGKQQRKGQRKEKPRKRNEIALISYPHFPFFSPPSAFTLF